VLGLPESDEPTLIDRLAGALQEKKLLLVLDNFEHVLAAVAVVSRLLSAGLGVRALVTSQAALHISGEQVMPLPPLLERDAVELFVRRARAADPSFQPSTQDARDIAEIVGQLDGMPLAIELAAARVRLLPPRALLSRLDDQLKLLRSGPIDAPERHRTLIGLVAWSYGLLTPSEQALLRRLSVFRGGFRLEAAEAVADGAPVDDVLSRLESLLEKSLLRRVADALEVRLSMSDAVREFAARELACSAEAASIARRHAEHFLAVVAAAEREFTRSGQREIQARLEADEHNLRAALQVLRTHGSLEQALAFCAAAWRFWHANGQMAEAKRILAELLERRDAPPLAHGRALAAFAGLSYWQADYSAALAAYKEALALFEQQGARLDVAETLFAISTTCTWSGAPAEGEQWADRALAAFRALGHRDGIGRVLMAHGFSKWMRGDLAGARPLWDESLKIARECGDHVEAATKEVALSAIRFGLGERRQAVQQVVHALDELVRRRNVSHVVMALDFVAAILVHEAPEIGCRLAGAADTLRESLGGGMRPENSGMEPARQVAERSLGAGRAAEAFRAGSELDLEAALGLAWTAVGHERGAAPAAPA
jgi:predicted ATPase